MVIEAMACGTPVLGFNRGSVSEVVQDGKTGIVVQAKDEARSGTCPTFWHWIDAKFVMGFCATNGPR